MRKVHAMAVAIMAVLFAPAVLAQEHYTEGPVWNVSLIRVKPAHMDEYLTSLRQTLKPFMEEEKRQGLILDYKLFLKQTQESPQDWDICLAIEYKNHAALDGLTAKQEAIRDKVLGGKQGMQQLEKERVEVREILANQVLQEIFLK